MLTIHKFEVTEIGRPFTHEIHKDSRFLTVNVQGNVPMMWFEVNTDSPKEVCKFEVVGTGWDIDAALELADNEYQWYRGTFFQGPWVWHLYSIYVDRDYDF